VIHRARIVSIASVVVLVIGFTYVILSARHNRISFKNKARVVFDQNDRRFYEQDLTQQLIQFPSAKWLTWTKDGGQVRPKYFTQMRLGVFAYAVLQIEPSICGAYWSCPICADLSLSPVNGRLQATRIVAAVVVIARSDAGVDTRLFSSNGGFFKKL
jgi:hypothetical protein